MSRADQATVDKSRNLRIFRHHNGIELTASPDTSKPGCWVDKELLRAPNVVLSVCMYSSKQITLADLKELAVVKKTNANIDEIFQMLSPELQTDKDVAIAAGNVNGNVLRVMPLLMKSNKQVVKVCVGRNASAIAFASDDLQCDVELFEVAVQDVYTPGYFLALVCTDSTRTKLLCENLYTALQDRTTALRLAACTDMTSLLPECWEDDFGFRIAELQSRLAASERCGDVVAEMKKLLETYERVHAAQPPPATTPADRDRHIQNMMEFATSCVAEFGDN
jgi:hypothetical protein